MSGDPKIVNVSWPRGEGGMTLKNVRIPCHHIFQCLNWGCSILLFLTPVLFCANKTQCQSFLSVSPDFPLVNPLLEGFLTLSRFATFLTHWRNTHRALHGLAWKSNCIHWTKRAREHLPLARIYWCEVAARTDVIRLISSCLILPNAQWYTFSFFRKFSRFPLFRKIGFHVFRPWLELKQISEGLPIFQICHVLDPLEEHSRSPACPYLGKKIKSFQLQKEIWSRDCDQKSLFDPRFKKSKYDLSKKIKKIRAFKNKKFYPRFKKNKKEIVLELCLKTWKSHNCTRKTRQLTTVGGSQGTQASNIKIFWPVLDIWIRVGGPMSIQLSRQW